MADEDGEQEESKGGLTLLDGCGCLGDGCVTFAPVLIAVIWLGNFAWSLT